ncbi:dienelactone hydrolase [Caballeronia sp. INDeC2]|uniref:alpha/beta hydrolase family protein n=1 Tax=Caballeronia sp. INDeC2 TaxID=2921747 RepID=UPI0020287B48|nr:dienelactone hydrolase [Caballeronia sp. INDeC2]
MRYAAVTALALVLALVLAIFAAPSLAANVGFEEVRIANGAEPPLTVGIWYPTDAPVAGNGLSLIVMSHGGGGSYDSHYDTALALAHAGFVAAAVSHAGDTFDDQSHVLELWRRPIQLRRLIDYMLAQWSGHDNLDPARIGAFGFSNGGFTVLVAAGGVPNLSEIAPYCRAHPDHDLCQALQHAGVDPAVGVNVPGNAWIADARIKAAVIAAPAFGFTFGRAGLRDVRIPIQLWRAADDRHQPDPFYDEAVRANLPRPPEFHVVAGAGHYDFLPPCNARLGNKAPALCTSSPGFDRSAFHERFNAEIVHFFSATLR